MSHTMKFPMGNGFNMEFYASLSGEPKPPFIYPHHIEREIELFILVEGDISFVVESRVYRLKRGDIIIECEAAESEDASLLTEPCENEQSTDEMLKK